MKTVRILIILAMGLVLSCNSDNDETIDLATISGTWSRVDVIPSGRSAEDFRYFDMETIYDFSQDETFSFKVNFYGFKDANPNEIVGQSINRGTFKVDGDSLFVKALTNISWDSEYSPEPETILLDGRSDGFRYEIKDNILTLYYVSYPADAPVDTQISYSRVD
jgi:hypothetical protein